MTTKTATSTPRKKPKENLKSAGELMLRTLFLQQSLTIIDVAEKLTVSPAFISQLVSGKRRSREIEKRLCRLLRIKTEQIWPDPPPESDQQKGAGND